MDLFYLIIKNTDIHISTISWRTVLVVEEVGAH